MPTASEKLGILQILREGEVKLEGQFLRGSNYTFFGHASLDGDSIPVVYKPVQGEQPLWDFPTRSLAKREAAAYIVSEALDWDLVPPTIYRRKGPLGPGSLQYYIVHDQDYHYFNFTPSDIQRLRIFVVFDIIVNNADRKGSHILESTDGHLFSIDHGVCFHCDDKLRTVIWDFSGEPLPQEITATLQALVDKLKNNKDFNKDLRSHLKVSEIKALEKRTLNLLKSGIFLSPPNSGRPFPWPPV